MKFLSFFESRSIFQILFMDILNFLKHMGENDVFSNPLYGPGMHFQKTYGFWVCRTLILRKRILISDASASLTCLTSAYPPRTRTQPIGIACAIR